MRKLCLMLFTSFLFISCNKNNNCYIEDFVKYLNFPENYDIIECNPDIYEIANRFKINEEDIKELIKTNKFVLYNSTNELDFKPHEYFINDILNYFDVDEPIAIEGTYFLTISKNEKIFLSCLITSDGDLYTILEK